MQDFKRGTARANQLTFEYLTEGDGPLALCVHGFPDSPPDPRAEVPVRKSALTSSSSSSRTRAS